MLYKGRGWGGNEGVGVTSSGMASCSQECRGREEAEVRRGQVNNLVQLFNWLISEGAGFPVWASVHGLGSSHCFLPNEADTVTLSCHTPGQALFLLLWNFLVPIISNLSYKITQMTFLPLLMLVFPSMVNHRGTPTKNYPYWQENTYTL